MIDSIDWRKVSVTIFHFKPEVNEREKIMNEPIYVKIFRLFDK